MLKLELSQHPEVKAIITAAFPGYKKHNCYVSTFGDNGVNINSYWDSGSRAEFVVVELSSRRRGTLPTSTHPYFDVSRRGLADSEDSHISIDRVGNIRLKHLPEGFVLIEAGISCGKAATAHVYLNSANMPRLLPAAV